MLPIPCHPPVLSRPRPPSLPPDAGPEQDRSRKPYKPEEVAMTALLQLLQFLCRQQRDYSTPMQCGSPFLLTSRLSHMFGHKRESPGQKCIPTCSGKAVQSPQIKVDQNSMPARSYFFRSRATLAALLRDLFRLSVALLASSA